MSPEHDKLKIKEEMLGRSPILRVFLDNIPLGGIDSWRDRLDIENTKIEKEMELRLGTDFYKSIYGNVSDSEIDYLNTKNKLLNYEYLFALFSIGFDLGKLPESHIIYEILEQSKKIGVLKFAVMNVGDDKNTYHFISRVIEIGASMKKNVDEEVPGVFQDFISNIDF